MTIKRIDHIAIVVDNMEGALEFWEDALGLQMNHMEEVADQESIVAFLPSGHSEVELVEPTSDASGVAKYLAKRGPGLHHICFEVDNIDLALARMKAKGVKLINETPTIGTGGKKIAFIHPSSTHGVLVELYELTPEEPMRRRRLIREWRSRLSTQRAVASAGLRTFVKTWRQASVRRSGNREQEEIVVKQN